MMHADGHDLPFDDLLWPVPTDMSRSPERSTLFEFAVLAWALDPASAKSEVDTFRAFQSARNDFAHGGKAELVVDPPAAEAWSLLDRFVRKLLTRS